MSGISKVSVCILSWNGRQHLESCLPPLRLQEPGIDWEVLVLDNGSSDGTADWVRREHPWVRLFESPSNSGFCAGNNRLAGEAGGDALVFLNNDTRPTAGWLAALVQALGNARGDVAAASGMIVDWEGNRLDFSHGIMTFDGHAFQIDFGRLLTSARLMPDGGEILFPCGGNMIIRKRSFLDAGGFDADYFAYYEDVDLGWRLWSGGERVIAATRAIVHHRSAATSQHLGHNRGLLFERNAFLTAYKNFDDALWQRIMPAVLLTLMSRTQSLLVQNNPLGGTLALDPFAASASTAGGTMHRVEAATNPGPRRGTAAWLLDRLRVHGPLGFLRRALALAGSSFFGKPAAPPGAPHPVLSDARTVSQFRAQQWILGHLDKAAEKRAQIQRRRKRPDDEIFRRFPLYVVPTYPGDSALFASAGFRAWLPEHIAFRHCELADVMVPDGADPR